MEDISNTSRSEKRIRTKAPPRKWYPSKNTDSNVSNQALSFLCSEHKSSAILMKCLTSRGQCEQDIFSLFYAYAKVIKKCRNKYISKRTLSSIATNPHCDRLQEVMKSPAYSIKLPIMEFCKLVRILLHYFLTNSCHLTVITSRKLTSGTRIEHFKRKR